MDKNQFSDFISFWGFVLSWEDSEEMQIDLRIDIQKKGLPEYVKAVFWILVSIMVSLLICTL